ncbi:MAG: trypsin-like peptidase domain-containing protein [Treponema sp.]|nr:trypsin-like peptidase domain-containing protein [Candidatus Treponema scatequi]
MKKLISKILVSLVLLTASANLFAQNLKPKIAEKVNQNVFEVVYLKIEEDPLSYEKELPLDRLPYQTRMDKYESIGTAFLLKDQKFYTAAHVLSFVEKTQADNFFIRSQDKKVYKITNIEKFATDRDFVVFDVEGFDDPKAKGLETDVNFKQNSVVFAVGNAQGEGIVNRNGLLTSTTPEHREGKWQWIRFSAAASPGNSGGPLVTPQGKVIGIVTMKNSSENLNYALPIKEVENVSDNKGIVRAEAYYTIPNITTQKFYHTLDFEYDLPKPIEELRTICYKDYRENTEKFFNDICTDYRFTGKENFVQNDKGNIIFTNNYVAKFPFTLCLNEKGKWGCYSPNQTSDIKLEKNGMITAGGMLGIVMSKLKKPDDVTIQEYIENPKLLMDTLAKIFVLSRPIGSEKITITSYGESIYNSTYKDQSGRTWIISAFNIPFIDAVVYNMALPLPDGIYSLTGIAQTSHIWNGFNYDMAFIADNTVAGYAGTTKECIEYLNIPESVYPRHEVLKGAKISVTDKETKFSTSSFDFTVAKNVMDIDDKSDIELGVSLRPDEKKGIVSVLSMAAIEAQKNTNDNAVLIYTKKFKPHEDSTDETKDGYDQICSKTIPYDGNPFENNQKTSVFIANVKDDTVSVVGLVYKGSKMDVIKPNLQKVANTLVEK